jgi:hypothetical protein
MPYAYAPSINHVFDTDHLNLYLTFRHTMKRTSDPLADPVVYDVMPPLEKWLLEADEVPLAAVDSEWIDEFTLMLTSDEILVEPAGVELEYAGPDAGLMYKWNKQIEPWGPLESYAGYPQMPKPHNSTHENGGSDEINVAGLTGELTDTQPSFTNRGDPNVVDWSNLVLTCDGAWHDLDLSAIVPEGTKAVLFAFYCLDNVASSTVKLRKKGNVNIINVAECRTQVANVAIYNVGIVACDADRKIQYYATNTVFTAIGLTVAGWWK